jgi:acyl-coenzyme A thioesterase PaaI-like protein
MSPAITVVKKPARLPRALRHSACFACGEDNAKGLRIRYELQKDGEMAAVWMPGAEWEGFQGIVHGGIVSTVLDEAMSKAVAATGHEALTAELRVRFRRQVACGKPFRIRGWIRRRNKRLFETEAVLAAADGTEHAHAWASFLELPGSGGRGRQHIGNDNQNACG